jgi:putative NIF3 family GTP cyclohydrolase 1 type 2
MLRAMALEPTEPLTVDGVALGFISRLAAPMTALDIVERIEAVTSREPLVFGDPDQLVATIGMLSGGGAGYFEAARRAGVDLFITGEAAESSQAMSEELGGMFVAAGHHATERFGVELLGRHLVQAFGMELLVIDIDNPV